MRSHLAPLLYMASCGLFPVDEQRCATDRDCPPEERCQAFAAVCTPKEICNNGADDDLDARIDCDDTADCFIAPDCATNNTLTKIELGAFLPGEEIKFPVPESALGFTITASGGDDNVIGVHRLTTPSGEVRLNGFEDDEMRQFSASGAIGFVFPEGDSYKNQMESGYWGLELGASQQEALDVVAWVRTGPNPQGAFSLNIYIPQGLRMCANTDCNGGAGTIVDEKSARESAEMIGLLHTLSDEILQPQIGIGVGEVLFHSIDQRYLEISSQEEFSDVLRESAGGGLHLFLTQSFAAGNFSVTTAGASSGIPGALQIPGSSNSGVVVKVALDPESSSNITGLIAAHELGHFMGLWHTTEANGSADLLEDTPSCPPEMIASNLSQCPDKENIMFPMIIGASGTLTQTQKQILRAGAGYQ